MPAISGFLRPGGLRRGLSSRFVLSPTASLRRAVSTAASPGPLVHLRGHDLPLESPAPAGLYWPLKPFPAGDCFTAGPKVGPPFVNCQPVEFRQPVVADFCRAHEPARGPQGFPQGVHGSNYVHLNYRSTAPRPAAGATRLQALPRSDPPADAIPNRFEKPSQLEKPGPFVASHHRLIDLSWPSGEPAARFITTSWGKKHRLPPGRRNTSCLFDPRVRPPPRRNVEFGRWRALPSSSPTAERHGPQAEARTTEQPPTHPKSAIGPIFPT